MIMQKLSIELTLMNSVQAKSIILKDIKQGDRITVLQKVERRKRRLIGVNSRKIEIKTKDKLKIKFSIIL